MAMASDIFLYDDLEIFDALRRIFWDTCPKFIRNLCGTALYSAEVLDRLSTEILNLGADYPKNPFIVSLESNIHPKDQLKILSEFVPDMDPEFLATTFETFPDGPNKIRHFLDQMIETKRYPRMKDYLRRRENEAEQHFYIKNFTVESFVKKIPNCVTIFEDPNRELSCSIQDTRCVIVFLKEMFRSIHIRNIQVEFAKSNRNIPKTIKSLRLFDDRRKMKKVSPHQPDGMPFVISYIPLLQQIAYYSHENEIKEYLKIKREEEVLERTTAIENGTIRTCICCFDDEVLPRDVVCCDSGCTFCKSCVARSTEIRFSGGHLTFPCLSHCPEHFSLRTLETIINPNLHSKISQRITVREIKRAEVPGLEDCPFCDFATIPAEGYTLFTCLNPDCMKESCRLCKEPAHNPWRCDEIEKNPQVKARTKIENKMTEALLRECWQCHSKFYKEDGCNRMKCSCGAMMCYVCKKILKKDIYTHFRMNEDDKRDLPDLCPLNSDMEMLHQADVLRGAEAAKTELKDGVELKHDPSADVAAHYEERARRNAKRAFQNEARVQDVHQNL